MNVDPHPTGGPGPASGSDRRPAAGGRRGLALAATAYLVLAVFVWWGAWWHGPTTTTTCGCGDSALFLWFFGWPAHAVAHGLDPFFSPAMSWPGGVNLLANTSVPGLALPLVPLTWAAGPVVAVNVALTLAPAGSALAAYALVRRWVTWAPAAFAAGLVYGFSPLVLVSLTDAHLMVGWAVVPPLLLLVADRLARGEGRPVVLGVVLGLLVVVQFFVGTEVLLIIGIVAVPGLLLAGGWAWASGATRGPEGARRVRGTTTGALAAAVTAVVVLAWPTWYALAGPAHTSGRVWPTLDLATEGSSLRTMLWPTPVSAGYSVFTHRVGGPQGPSLSGAYLGWGLVAVAVVGLVVFRRDRRLWWFGAMTVVSGALALGSDPGPWAPWAVLGRWPILQNIIPGRFELVTFLGLAVMLGLVVDHTREVLRARPGATRGLASGAAVAVAAVGLVPVAVYLRPGIPMTVVPMRAPTWFTTVAPRLAPHTVLLVFPVPYEVVESSMAWQSVTGFPYVMVGGGGPGGVVQRAGAERAAEEAIGRASFSFTPQRLRPGDVAATRRALVSWGVDEVVLPDEAAMAPYDRVTSVPYTVAFVTAVTGRPPLRQAGAWVWPAAARHLPVGPGPAPDGLASCVALGASGTPVAIERVARCTVAQG